MIYEQVIFLGDGWRPIQFYSIKSITLGEAVKRIRENFPGVNGVVLVIYDNRYKFIGYLGDIVV